MQNVNDYTKENTCTYKEEVYLVRDNGAVMRLSPEGKKARPLDNVWMFGKKNELNGYMTIGSHRVHIIVATAFYGPKDSKIYVVDHIDTNRCNNRTENLRWLTKLENILLNDFTRKKIEWICGSVERFLENPSLLKGYEFEDRNFEWMRTVSKQEAENTLRNWRSFMERPKLKTENSKAIGEWIYNKTIPSRFVTLSKVNSPEQMHEERLQAIKRSEEVRNQRELQEMRNNDQKLQETKMLEKQKRDKISILKEAILTSAQANRWIVRKNVVGHGWKADFVVESVDARIGIMLCKSTRNLQEKHEAMKAEDVKDCWLGSSFSQYGSHDLFPCFEVDIRDTEIKAKLSENYSISLDELLWAMMHNRLQQEDYISIKKIKVQFIPVPCYRCGAQHYLYSVNYLVSDGYSCNSDGIVEPFDPIIINSVKRYLSEHPKLNYPMGEIKERFSKTRNEGYLSFGCPECDELFGKYYVDEYLMDSIYDDKYIHYIDLDEPGLKLNYKHWVVL